MTPEQLKALMTWVWFAARLQAQRHAGSPLADDSADKVRAVQFGLYQAFGFAEDAAGWPEMAGSIENGDRDSKIALIAALFGSKMPLRRRQFVASRVLDNWTIIKAIVEGEQ